MKFGFYSPYLDTFGGGERYMLSLASHLAQNHLVDIFWDDVNIKPPLARFLKIDLTKTRFVKNIFAESLAKRAFAMLGYNLIFVLSDGSIPSTFAPKNILHFQVPFNFQGTSLSNKLKLKRYNYVVCNSNFTKKFIDKSFNVNSIVIYPPVDIQSIKPGKKENLIISVGRFSAHQLHPKKQEVLIEIFKELSKKAKGWRLVLAGQAKKEDEKYLRQLKKACRGFAIRIEENMPIEELGKLYSQASIYWHATGFGEDELKNPEKMEHFGISTVEAQAGGAVPVVIDKGGQKEIVQEGKNGLLWTTKAQLYEQTLRLINSPDLIEKLSLAAIRNSKRFDQEKFFRKYGEIIL
ncbi:MAG: glycosyltransferase family 4 protein [Candidatus Curtissbacteria bacterium]|nr:glycosyltransferase family 4 protein [Candidatus Curtissbacteria bacterium]